MCRHAAAAAIDAHTNYVHVQMSRVGLDKDLEDLLDVRRDFVGSMWRCMTGLRGGVPCGDQTDESDAWRSVPRVCLPSMNCGMPSGMARRVRAPTCSLPRVASPPQITYINAPNPASGPIPDDVAPFFEGPYYECVPGPGVGGGPPRARGRPAWR